MPLDLASRRALRQLGPVGSAPPTLERARDPSSGALRALLAKPLVRIPSQ